MAKMKRFLMDAEEKFFDQATDIIKKNKILVEATTEIEKLRSVYFNFLSAEDMIEQATEYHYEYWT